MVKCKYNEKCIIYDRNSNICNDDVRVVKCGKYKSLEENEKKQKRLIDFVA